MNTTLLHRTRAAWEEVLQEPGAFRAGETIVLVKPLSRIAPPGWIGIVALGDAAVVVAPNDEVAAAVGRSLYRIAPADVPDAAAGRAVGQVLGPASLFFSKTAPAAVVDSVERFAPDDPRIAALVATASNAEAEEAGLDESTSPLFAWTDDRRVVAACGYRNWPGSIAHLSVLADPAFRRRGYARVVASAAIADAHAHGLLPQWRAQPSASRALARSLRLERLGTQVSLVPGGPSGATTLTCGP